MKKTKMLVITASIVLGLGTAVEAKLPSNAIVVGNNVYDVGYLMSNISKINDEIMNNLGYIFYVDNNNVTKDIFTGSTIGDPQLVNKVGNTLNYYTSNGAVEKLVADSNNEFDPNGGTIIGDMSAIININYKRLTVGTQTLYAYTVKVNTVSGLQDAAYFSLDTSSTVPLSEVNTYIGGALVGAPRLTIYDTARNDIASGPVTGVALNNDTGNLNVTVSLHYNGAHLPETGNGNSTVNLDNTGFSAVDSSNEWMYYVNTADRNKLYKKSIGGVDDSPISDDRVGYINILGDWIYYINYSDGSKIYKVRTNGAQKQKVSDDMASCLNILSGKIYYINHSDRSRIYVIDSQGNRQFCSDSANFLSAGTNNFLYYVNTLDGNKLYKYLLTNDTKGPVSDVSVQFLNVINDNSVLYTGKNGQLYTSSGSYYANQNGLIAVTNVPTGKGNNAVLKALNDRLTVICAEDDNNIYYKSYVDGGKLYKLDKKSGNGYRVVNDSVDYVNIIGDYIYYMKGGKLYYIPKNSDGTTKGNAVTKPKSTLKISSIGTINPIRTDDISKINFPDTVPVTMSDGTTVDLIVNWNKTIPKPSKGVYTFTGTILGYGSKVTLQVTLDSGVIDIANVSVINGVGSKDTVTVTKLNQGDVINVYTGYSDIKPVKSATAGANGTAVLTGFNLNPNGDYLYITITKQGKAEGEKTAYLYGPETPVNFAVDAANGKITGLKSGMQYKVFLEILDKNGNLPDTPDPTKQIGGIITAGSDGSLSVPQLSTMTDLKQLRIIATNSKDSASSSAVEVGKPTLDGVAVDLANSRITGTTVDMEYSYAYDKVNNPNAADWTPCSAVSTPVSMTRSLQVSVRKKANGPYLQSDIASYGLFPAPVVTGITDGGTYSIGSDLTAAWPADVNDSNGTITYKAALYNLTDNTSNTNITNVTGNTYSSNLIELDSDGKTTDSKSIIKTGDITGTGKNYKLVVTATKVTPSGLIGQSQTTINFAVTAGKPQTVDISMFETPGTMKLTSNKRPKDALASDWIPVNPTTDALTYYSATPRWYDYPSTSSTAVIQRLDLESIDNRDLSQVDLTSMANKSWNLAAKVSFAPNTPITQDGYYKLTVTSVADDNKATVDTVKYFIVDTGRDAVLPTITGVEDNGTYSSGIKPGITIADDTNNKESITIPTLIRDGYVTPLVDNSGNVIKPTSPGISHTSGDITLKGNYQLDLNTVNVVNGKKAHKTYNFYVDNTAAVSPDVDASKISTPDNNTVEISDNIPYGSTIKVYSSSGSLLGSQPNYGVPGSVSVNIPGGIPTNETSIYVTRTDIGKQESNRTQYNLKLSPSIKSISPTVFNEVDDTGKISGMVNGTKTSTIAVEIQNGTVNDGIGNSNVTAANLPSGLKYNVMKLDATHVGITFTDDPASYSDVKNSVSNLTFTINSGLKDTKGKDFGNPVTTQDITINFNSTTKAVDGTTIKANDVGNNGNGSDLKVTFNKSDDETSDSSTNKVGSYRVIVVKNTKSLDNVAAANAVASGNYTSVTPTGQNLAVTLSASAKDSDGDAITNGSYKVYVLTVADGTNANLNALSGPASVTLNNAQIAPTVTSAVTVDATHIALTMSSALTGTSADKNAFSITGLSPTNPSVTGVTVIGTTVTLTLNSPITSADIPKVSYTASGTNDLTNGTKVANFSNQAVTNNLVPTVVNAQTTGTNQIELTMSSALSGMNGNTAAFTINGANTNSPSITGVIISGTKVTITLDKAIAHGETITLTYAQKGTNDLTNGTTKVANFISYPVANNN